ncbi:MAG TPA: thioredoxin domain-containing protein [Gaiellaceae bacterium]
MKRIDSRRLRLGIAFASAAVFAVLLIAASQIGAATEKPPAPSAAPDAAERLFAGIPQKGPVLGSPRAPLTLVEYADLQCPYCAQWALQTLPVLVEDYVRTGRLRIVFRGLAFIGPDSELAVKTAIAAGRHGRLWDVVDALYRAQGAENSGWVDDELLAEIAGQAHLDYDRLAAERDLPAVERELAQARRAAAVAGVRGTPAFALGRTGGPPALLRLSSLAPEGIVPPLEEAQAA